MVRTIEEQTGWRRGFKLTTCHTPKVLDAVTEFDYDIDNAEFVKYFESRTGVMISKCECGWEPVRTVLANWRVEAPSTTWRITRARLQDCWQIWTAQQNEIEEDN